MAAVMTPHPTLIGSTLPRRFVALVGLAAILSACGGGTDGTADGKAPAPSTSTDCAIRRGETSRTIDRPEGPRTFDVYGPTSAPTGVVFDFHGTGGVPGTEDAFTRLSTAGPAKGFVVVQPQALGTPAHWTVPGIAGPDDQALTQAILDSLRSDWCLDGVSVFATGISSGAGMATALACAGAVRAAAPIAGVALVRRCPTGSKVSVLTFHGTKDQAVPYDGTPGWQEREKMARGFFVGAMEPIMSAFARRDGCGTTPSETPVGVETTRMRWPHCAGGTEVVAYRVAGGGHNAPGTQALIDAAGINDQIGPSTDDIVATDVLLDFFARHVAH